ncbi:acyl-CoA dehydrogenase family protein [Actinocrispum wychmicini]|uniref:Acyl-CoA dehydrogenase/citronellyl-CoA dehydrogenase n=1 Tax=Actinocrispum wychmicini TaxID=1213861 RepID=A0A4R2J5Q8_9PSEU|nr:acyl-CoA dehydrogenase family protein [Actinocrispum wychmicini]TCO54261.1 acyl-CoA dehydrogenase/citronellyl-CoA dehydrogenase [Actinocrispum wychmicini]
MTTPSSVLAADHRELVDSFATFVSRELEPLAGELDAESDIPPRELTDYVRRRSAALGFYAADYPEEVGGGALPFAAMVALYAAANRSGCRLAPYALAGSDGPSPLLLHGTPHQRKQYLEPLVRGQKTRCFGLTEPQAGSDAFTLTTTARRVGDRWALTGRKIFVSNAEHADFAVIVAAVREAGERAVPAVFVLAIDEPGLVVGQRFTGMSGEPLSEIVLDDVRVADDAVIGIGDAAVLEHGIASLSRGRLVVAAICVGIAEHALALGLRHARHRHSFGRPIGDYQHVQDHLVRSRAEVEAAALLTFAAARLVDEGVAAPENAALAKLTASTTAVRVVDRAVQIHGAAAWVKGHPLEFLYRHVRMMTIIEGTTEIQKVIIARAMGLGGDLERSSGMSTGAGRS